MKLRPVTVALGLVAIWILWWGSCEAISRFGGPPARQVGPPAAKEKVEVQDLVIGKGPEANTGSTISVKYVGTFTNGQEFDSTHKQGGQPMSVRLGAGDVIRGWDIGLVGIRVGGKRRLRIPPSLGYPNGSPAGSIPPNTTLIFEVERVK